jgi:hypothetical protein
LAPTKSAKAVAVTEVAAPGTGALHSGSLEFSEEKELEIFLGKIRLRA